MINQTSHETVATGFPRISVITVVRNGVDTIPATLASVREQTYDHVEHVIVDGLSDDGTWELIQQHREQLGPILREGDRGVYEAMNKGIRLATGDILFFLNADDIFHDAEVLADVAAVFQQDPELKVVYGNLVWKIQDKLVLRKQPYPITREFLAGGTVLHQTVFAHQEVFAKTDGFSEEFRVISDYEWMLKVFLRDAFKNLYVDRKIAIMDTGGLSWTTKWERERRQVMRDYFSSYDILRYRAIPLQQKKFTRVWKKWKRWRKQRRKAAAGQGQRRNAETGRPRQVAGKPQKTRNST